MQPEQVNPPVDDAVNRLLHRMEPSSEALWREAQNYVSLDTGILVIDDSTLDKFYAQKIELASGQESMGKLCKELTCGALLWTQGDSHIPCDYCLYDKSNDSATKNDHFRAMLQTTKQRNAPTYLRSV